MSILESLNNATVSVNPYSLTSGTSKDYLGISNVLAFFLNLFANQMIPIFTFPRWVKE